MTKIVSLCAASVKRKGWIFMFFAADGTECDTGV